MPEGSAAISASTAKAPPARESFRANHGLLFAGEDGHAKSGNSHESDRGGDHIIGAGGGVFLILGGLGLLGRGDDDGDGAGDGGGLLLLDLPS